MYTLQQKHLKLTAEMIEMAKGHRSEMLVIAKNCYLKASECDIEDKEEWLHHYMLGKVAEKMAKPPGEYLEHYKKVL